MGKWTITQISKIDSVEYLLARGSVRETREEKGRANQEVATVSAGKARKASLSR